MLKRYLLPGILVITVALIITVFVGGNIKKANGSLSGKSNALVGTGNGNGNRDFIPPSALEVASHAGNSIAFMSESRGARDFSSQAVLSAAFVSDSRGARDFNSQAVLSAAFVSESRGARDFSSPPLQMAAIPLVLPLAMLSESRGARDFGLLGLIPVTGGR